MRGQLMQYNTVAALPTRTMARAGDPDTWSYANEPGVTGYVLRKVGGSTLKLFTSHGSFGWNVGDNADFYHDRTLRSLGWWKVVSIVHIGRAGVLFFEGDDIPRRKVGHWVAK